MDNYKLQKAKEFTRFYSTCFPGKTIPCIPKSIDDLNILEREAMRQFEGGVMFQNYFRDEDALPPDIFVRYSEGGRYNTTDVEGLRKANFEHEAVQLEKRIEESRMEIMNMEIEASKQRQAVKKQQLDEFNKLPLGHPLKQPSQESIMRARQQWNITDRPSWEMDQNG